MLKKQKQKEEELGRRGQSNSQEKQHLGEKGATEKEHNHEKELGKISEKAKEKAIEGRIYRERSNNAMLKRTEKRKQ